MHHVAGPVRSEELRVDGAEHIGPAPSEPPAQQHAQFSEDTRETERPHKRAKTESATAAASHKSDSAAATSVPSEENFAAAESANALSEDKCAPVMAFKTNSEEKYAIVYFFHFIVGVTIRHASVVAGVAVTAFRSAAGREANRRVADGYERSSEESQRLEELKILLPIETFNLTEVAMPRYERSASFPVQGSRVLISSGFWVLSTL